MSSNAQQGQTQIHAGPPLRARQLGQRVAAPEGVYKCVSSLPPPAGTFTGVVGASLGGSSLAADAKPQPFNLAQRAPHHDKHHDLHPHPIQGSMLGVGGMGLTSGSGPLSGAGSVLNSQSSANTPLSVLVQAQQPRQPPPPRVALLTLRYHKTGAQRVEFASEAQHAAALTGILRDATWISQGTIPVPPLREEQPNKPITEIAHYRRRGGGGLSSLLQPQLAEVGPSLPLVNPEDPNKPEAHGKRASTAPTAASESFVARYSPIPDLERILSKSEGSGETETFAFVSLDKTLIWMLDVGGRKSKEPLTRITFAQPITAVTVNGASARPGPRPAAHMDLSPPALTPDASSGGSHNSDHLHDSHNKNSTQGRIDVALGFSTGDVVWLDPVSARWSHMNVGGCLHSAAVTSLKWVPGTYLIFVAFADGMVLLLEAGRADWRPHRPDLMKPMSKPGAYCHVWIPKQSRPTLVRKVAGSASQEGTLKAHDSQRPHEEVQEVLDDAEGTLGSDALQSSRPAKSTKGYALVDSWDEARELLVTHPGNPARTAKGPNLLDCLARGIPLAALGTTTDQTTSAGTQLPFKLLNPVSAWRVSRHRITDFAFAPPESLDTATNPGAFGSGIVEGSTEASLYNGLPLVAITDLAGYVRVIDMEKEEPLHTCKSYFGGLTCVAWSPDGRFLATGGEDDLITLWAPREGQVIARAQGHTSFVTNIAFDPWRWPVEKRTYRLGSVGEDGRIFLWDFSHATLHRPKGHNHGPSIGGVGAADGGGGNGGKTSTLDPAAVRPLSGQAVVHLPPTRAETASILPIVSHRLSGTGIGILTRVYFSAQAITLIHRDGGIDVFARPGEEHLFHEEIDTDLLVKAIKAAQAASTPQNEKDSSRNWSAFKRRDVKS